MRFYVPFLSLLTNKPLDYTRLFPLTIAEFCDYACKVAGCYLETPAFLARCSFGPDNLPYNAALRNMPLGSSQRGSQWISQFPTITLDEAKRIVEKAGIKVKINEGYEEGVAHFARLLGTPALNPNIVVRADNYSLAPHKGASKPILTQPEPGDTVGIPQKLAAHSER